ncbi:uncharacterized protein SRS1_25075 [Sporisorium reilianum f. sp. reilianum]|uniref:Uncharacterized protein n=1 Tax=Sporisorium reilianum f. sp. reilianum TaxID=72559 RepID=A0A2N8U987_9BASI|nr:uncharacterized protein SRS1_25075 [Sporisorium reilianum f. sp. reilianum]
MDEAARQPTPAEDELRKKNAQQRDLACVIRSLSLRASCCTSRLLVANLHACALSYCACTVGQVDSRERVRDALGRFVQTQVPEGTDREARLGPAVTDARVARKREAAVALHLCPESSIYFIVRLAACTANLAVQTPSLSRRDRGPASARKLTQLAALPTCNPGSDDGGASHRIKSNEHHDSGVVDEGSMPRGRHGAE